MATAAKAANGVTECSICTEAFTDPRVLPCVHTYCLKCILTWAKDKSPGDSITCPECCNEFVIPNDGLQGLPKNFFVEKIHHIGELVKSGTQSTPCDMCTYMAKSGAAQVNTAINYCLVCQESYCQMCTSAHQQQQLSRDRMLLHIGHEIQPEDLLVQHPPAKCDKHADETLNIYCNTCKMVICVMCYDKDHSAHKYSDINEVKDEFHAQMSVDVTAVEENVKECKKMLQSLMREKENFDNAVAKTEREIREKTKQLRELLDTHEASLLSELKSVAQKRTKKVDTAVEEVERLQTRMDSYTKYVRELLEKGTARDIARAASGLHDRAEDLLTLDDIERKLSDLGQVVVAFSSYSCVPNDFKKTAGQLKVKVKNTATIAPTLTHVVPGETGICSVTSLGDRVYAVRRDQKEVEVYDSETLTLVRRLPVPQLAKYAEGIAACGVNGCLYLSDWKDPSIVRVDLHTDAVRKWAVGQFPRHLSVTSDHNVLVTCFMALKLQEYTTDGRRLRQICLQQGNDMLWHAIQLSTGHYVVSQSTLPGVVSVVGVDGQVVCSYGNSSTSDVEPLNEPTSLAVTKHGDVLVADNGNNRILAINSSFSRAQVFPLPTDLAQFLAPYALHLDESRDRLYMGELGGDYRLIVLDNVRRIHWNK